MKQTCKDCRYYLTGFCNYFRKKWKKIDWSRKDIVHCCEVFEVKK